jgi:hypothetical protein
VLAIVFTEILSLSWEKMKQAFDDYNLRKLVAESFDARPSVRVLARVNLKKNYPEVFAEIEALKQ